MEDISMIYKGAADRYLYAENRGSTFLTKFLETRSQTITLQPDKLEPVIEIPQAIQEEFIDVHERFLYDPDETLDEYCEFKKTYSEYMPYLLHPKKKLPTRYRVEMDRNAEGKEDPSSYGYTSLRITGNPKSIQSIALEIGGQRMDKVYPSVTRKFDTIHLFDVVIPRPIYHRIWLTVEPVKDLQREEEFTVEWDVVTIQNPSENYDLLIRSTQYTGEEDIAAGESRVNLNFNHPIETLKIYSTERVDMTLNLNKNHNTYIPYAGKQGDNHVYKLTFVKPVNFSRMDNSSLTVKSNSPAKINTFATSWNVIRFMKGMAGLAFSK